MSQRRLRLDVRAEVRVLPLISRILRVPQLQTGGVAARIVRSRESFRIISWAYHHAGMIRNERQACLTLDKLILQEAATSKPRSFTARLIGTLPIGLRATACEETSPLQRPMR
jgi:hypothetical protein